MVSKTIFALSASAAICASSIVGLPAVVHAEDDPALQQTVTDSENIAPAGESTVITQGHVDLGPLLIDGDLDFLARDDTADQPVWRHLDDVVFQLSDTAKQVLPESGDYDFTGAKAGDTVWAVPQTQVADVPWLGWNTQSPAITQNVQRGITLEYGGHQGPGQFSVFLQSGGFGKPQLLWDSNKSEAQPIWVDLKTHTHANWVFTEPGVHLVSMTVKAKMLDGSEKSVSKILRFAVGVDPAEAASATWQGQVATSSEASNDSEDAAAPSNIKNEDDNSVIIWVAVGLFVFAGLAVVLSLIMRRRNQREQAAVEAEMRGSDD